jgi:hypothetical protein
MPEWKVSKFELESLIRGFTVSEREGWNRVSPEEYSHLPAVLAYPQAFSDGVELKAAVNMIFSADSTYDFNRDKASYDRVVEMLNEKYGKVALTSSEVNESKTQAYGIIGYRFTPWGQIVTTNYSDGTVSVDFPKTRLEMEDEIVRKEIGLEL